MNYAAIKYCDIANGPGVRTSLFVSGCTHHCPGCFNAVAWDFAYGQPFTTEAENAVFDSLRPDYITGLTLLGGEPMELANQEALLPFLRRMRESLPDKTIWCYSGYTWEQLRGEEPSRCFGKHTSELLKLLDVLVDGRFEEEKHDITLRFRGSANQRVIDVRKSLDAGKVCLWEDQKIYADHAM